uniref:NR LBD domain-containing protein n=1 Tax=Caenorhabditis tropicalis TaxID=1561998 RepID=A0A1I7TVU7_9PELO
MERCAVSDVLYSFGGRLSVEYSIDVRGVEAIQIRDVIGPRTRSSRSTPDTPKLDFNSILDLQRVQWTENQGEEEKQGVFMKNAYHRQATPLDINQGLSLAIQNSRDLINNLEIPNTRLSEASIAFMLIDQAFKTSREATDGFWLLQNGSYIGLHPDFKFEGQGDEAKEKCHFDFVTQLIDTIGKPFGTLEIDEMDCVMLKVLVLASDPSDLRDQCLKTLLSKSGPERFGEIILLISSIRCAVKAFYNVTRESDLFNYQLFDQVVRDVLVE